MQKEERPREKAKRFGIESLSTTELLALLLRCGYRGSSVLQVAQQLLSESKGLVQLSQMDAKELIKIKGISETKVLELQACFEISKRISSQTLFNSLKINSPKIVSEYLNKKIGYKKQEHFVVLMLDTKNQLIKEMTLFVGSLNTSVVHAREVYKCAIEHASAKIMIAHNHPSGECIPSEQDILVTDALQQVGELVGIPLLDHIIVGNNQYFSFKEKQLMK